MKMLPGIPLKAMYKVWFAVSDFEQYKFFKDNAVMYLKLSETVQ